MHFPLPKTAAIELLPNFAILANKASKIFSTPIVAVINAMTNFWKLTDQASKQLSILIAEVVNAAAQKLLSKVSTSYCKILVVIVAFSFIKPNNQAIKPFKIPIIEITANFWKLAD